MTPLLLFGLFVVVMATALPMAGFGDPRPPRPSSAHEDRRNLLPAPLGPSFALGSVTGTGEPFVLTREALATHMAVLGSTGAGKSRFLNLFLRYQVAARSGFCLIDPHGDLCEDVLAYCARRVVETGQKSLLPRLHYLEPSYEMAFGYDPFRFTPPKAIHPELRESAYRAWLHAKADAVSEIIQLKQGSADFEGMPRLQRVLRDVLIAVGTAVDDKGSHLPLADALVLLDVDHRHHHDVFNRVAPRLDRDVLSDFNRLHQYRRVEDRMRETESTINRLRSLLSPIVKEIFRETTNTIDLFDIVQKGHILLVNLRKTPYFSHDQKIALGTLLRREIVTTLEITPREMRKPFSLVMDEAGEFIGEDLQRDLGAVRKYGLSIVLAAQDLSSFRKKDIDMAPKVLSQCGTIVCFQQKWPDDLEILARVLGYGNLDFTPLVHEVERHDGYDWHDVTEYSYSATHQRNWSSSESKSKSRTRSQQQSHSTSTQETWSDGQSSQSSDSSVRSEGQTSGTSASRSYDEFGHPMPNTRAGKSESESSSKTTGRSSSAGQTSSRGGSEGESDSESEGHAEMKGTSRGTSQGGSEGNGTTESHKRVPLARIVRETQETGSLQHAVNDQFEQMKAQIHALHQRRAVVKRAGERGAFVMETHEVKDPFISSEAQAKAVDWMKRELFQIHPYYLTPSLSPGDEHHRLERFANAEPATPHGVAAPEPDDTNPHDV